MIKTFAHEGLRELFEQGETSRKQLYRRVIERLDAPNRAADVNALNIPGWQLHSLKQFRPRRYSISVAGGWRITFGWDHGDAYGVDFDLESERRGA